MSNPPCFKHSSVLPKILWTCSHLIKWCHLRHTSESSFTHVIHGKPASNLSVLCLLNPRNTKCDSESENCSVVSDSLQPHELYSPWNSVGQNTGMGSLSLLQGIFPTQGSNQGSLHYRWVLYQLSYWGSPKYSKWSQSWPLWPFLLPYIMPNLSLFLTELLLKDPKWLIVLDQYLLSSYDVADVW